VEHLSRYSHRRPDQLGPEQSHHYQAMLFRKLKFSPNTVIQRLAPLRFFYIKVLKKNGAVPRRLSEQGDTPAGDLQPEELARLINATELPSYRIFLITLYGTGARRAEVAHLKVGDIHSRG
jgi:integrase/recombinase XerD